VTKRKKTAATKPLWTSDEKENYAQGLQTLARVIARAYLRDMDLKSENKILPGENPEP